MKTKNEIFKTAGCTVLGCARGKGEERKELCHALLRSGATVYDCGICPLPALRLGKDICRTERAVYIGSTGRIIWQEKTFEKKPEGKLIRFHELTDSYIRSMTGEKQLLAGIRAEISGDFSDVLERILRSMGCGIGSGIKLELKRDGAFLEVNNIDTPSGGDAIRTAVGLLTRLRWGYCY